LITWRQQVLCTILFILARMFNEDEEIDTELKRLATHIKTKTTIEYELAERG